MKEHHLCLDISYISQFLLDFIKRDDISLTNSALNTAESTLSSIFAPYYITIEAIESSAIENINAGIIDVLLYERGGTPIHSLTRHVEQVVACKHALQYGAEHIHTCKSGIPVSLWLKMHAILMNQPYNQHKQPGQFRTVQCWIGGRSIKNAIYVPPAPADIDGYIRKLDAFTQSDDNIDNGIVDSSLIHICFESIHPFADGNGRIGRILILLYLMAKQKIKQPFVPISSYIYAYRKVYYTLLNDVRSDDCWKFWVDFMTQAIKKASMMVSVNNDKILGLVAKDKKQVMNISSAKVFSEVYQCITEQGVVSVNSVATKINANKNIVRNVLKKFAEHDMIHKINGQGRKHFYVYSALVSILQNDDPLFH